MRRSLGTLTAAALTGATLAVTAACGSSSSNTATDPASDPAGHPSRSPGVVAGATVLPLISMTGGGGRTTTTATHLDSQSDVRRFLAQFSPAPMRLQIRHAVAAAKRTPGGDLYGQVVAIGCDRPPGVVVMVGQDGQVQLEPREVASPLPECLAAVTTVAIVSLPLT